MFFVAVSACPAGIAHTYLAAESLEIAAKKAGVEMKVETQGTIGIENKITAEDVKRCDIVILTNDISILEEERFRGKPIVRVSSGDAIKKPEAILQKIKLYLQAKR